MSPGIPQDRIDAVLDRIETWSTKNDCPGGSVAITDGEDLLANRGFGYRTLDPETPATGGTRYAVGSVAKPITALAVLVLDARGHVDVHEPVPEYVPVFEDAPGEPISVHQLLSHTAGMPDDDLAWGAAELDGWDQFREFLDGTVDRRREDGDRFLYYNSGYTVLARLVEAVTGTDFPAFVEQEIFDPLGMDQSTFDGTALEDGSNDVMAPYVTADDGFSEVTVADNPVLGNPLLNGPGGLVTSVTDLARFVDAYIGDDLEDVPLERTYTPVGTRKRLVDGTEYTYGYGWERRPLGSDTLVGHGGNTGASAGFVGFLADRGIGIALGWNARPDEGPWSIASEALAVLSGNEPGEAVPHRSLEAGVRELTGRYESYSGENHVTVRVDGARLAVELGGGIESVELEFTPIAVEEGQYQFTSVEGFERTPEVEFFVTGDGVELLFEGALLERVETGSGKRCENGDG